jgi:serine/threonine-protein kinase
VLNGRFCVESVANKSRSVTTLVATDNTKRTRVAIDVLVATGEGIDAVRRAFLAGARASTPIEGPHVARVLDGGVTSDGLPWVAREEAPPLSLAAVLAEHHSLTTAQAVDIALAVCDALAEAHAHDVVHCALDTRSIRLVWTSDGPTDVKIADLGTMGAVARLERSALRAPEQLEANAPVEERTDVWALGVLLYTMLAGAPPFAAETPSGVNLSVALDEPDWLAGVPDEIADLVDLCLAKNPALRPPGIIAVAEALVPFATAPKELIERIRLHDTAPTLLVKKEDYKALAIEMKDAAVTTECPVVPAPSSLDIVVDVERSVRDVTALLPKRPPSVPPVSISIAPETRRSATSQLGGPSWTVPWKPALLGAAAACLLLAGFIALRPGPKRAATTPPPAPIATVVEPAPVDIAAAVTATMTPTNANSLPDAPVKKTTTAPKASASAHHRAAASAAPTHEPEPVAPTPQPKASDDDLRRFLDDRR